MNNIMPIISKLNGGSIIPQQKDDITKKNLYSDISQLYINKEDGRYYFFSEYSEEYGLDNIEKSTIRNVEAFADGMPSPSDSYLILFWKVQKVTDIISSRIIQLEENEFFYKKYVFYYTEQELLSFTKWYEEKSSGNELLVKEILQMLSQEKEYINDYFRFAVRLLTKIPYWRLEFPRTTLGEFEILVEKEINSIRGARKDEILKLKNWILELDSNGTISAETLAKLIYQKKIGEKRW